MKVKAAKKCDDYLARTNALLQLYKAGDFEKCTVKTTTTPAPLPPTNLGCLGHHNPEVGNTVLQSSEATCPGQVLALNAILKSCGLKSSLAGGITCSAPQNGASMLAVARTESVVKATTRHLTKALQAFDAELPTVSVIEGVYTNARKCAEVVLGLNTMIAAGFTCPA